MIVDSVRPNYVVVGDDWQQRDYNTQMGWDDAWLRDRDIQIAYVPYTKQISTTMLTLRMP
jgi:hypothetical protein